MLADDRRFVFGVWAAWLAVMLLLLAISGAVDVPPLHPHMASLKRGGHGPLWLHGLRADLPRSFGRITAAAGVIAGTASVLFLPQVFP